MRIVQLVPTVAYGDAVGNDAIALKQVLKSIGCDTEIYSESVVPPLDRHTALNVKEMPELVEEDIAILHLSTGAELNYEFGNYKCRKVIRYHNVTPPHFFADNDPFIRGINEWALQAVKDLAERADYCLADSEFNKQDLIQMGYTCPIDVLPILIPMDDYKKQPNKGVLKKYQDDWVNIVFTGRIAPNKCQEDIIRAFTCYKNEINPKSRLFLLGSYKEENLYYRKLRQYVKELKVKDVIFTGHISFDSILAYYKLATVFLCMSEHEGFCVPLVEAMLFDVPVIAYDSTAIPYTLQGSGFLLDTKEPMVAAKVIDRLCRDEQLRAQILSNQRIRLQDFAYDKIREQFIEYIKPLRK